MLQALKNLFRKKEKAQAKECPSSPGAAHEWKLVKYTVKATIADGSIPGHHDKKEVIVSAIKLCVKCGLTELWNPALMRDR